MCYNPTCNRAAPQNVRVLPRVDSTTGGDSTYQDSEHGHSSMYDRVPDAALMAKPIQHRPARLRSLPPIREGHPRAKQLKWDRLHMATVSARLTRKQADEFAKLAEIFRTTRAAIIKGAVLLWMDQHRPYVCDQEPDGEEEGDALW